MKIKFVWIVFLFVLMLFGSGCTQEKYERNDLITVTVSDGKWYYCSKNTHVVHRGDDVTVRLIFQGESYPEGCSYQNAKIKRVGDRYYDLTLYCVRYPAFVKIEENDGNDAIQYDANGGTFTDGVAVNGYLTGKMSVTHRRTNTDLGHELQREGYLLTGWNTRADGNGEHIGLGSRVSIDRGEKLTLFAEWKKTVSEREFDCELRDGCLYLIGYRGNDFSEFVIPEKIGNENVYGIGYGFLRNRTIDRLILPKTLSVVENNAFEACDIAQLYLYDAISKISDNSFYDCNIARVFVNAADAPRYQKDTEIAYFADAIDRLILLRDRKKIVFFSGCSFAYGLDSAAVKNAVGEEYEVVNVGVIGGTNAGGQLDIISHFMGENDVLVHAPEVASQYQFMQDNSAEARMFLITEGNYDLLSLVDIARIDGFFDKFAVYCNNRRSLPYNDYNDYSDAYNEYGDILKSRPYTGEDKSFRQEVDYTYYPEYVNERSSALLDSYYQKIRDRGARVAITYAPVNFHGLPEKDRAQKQWKRLAQNIELYFRDRDVCIISEAEDYLLAGRYFYDEDYHLNDEGVRIRTEQLLNDMKRYGIYGRGL